MAVFEAAMTAISGAEGALKQMRAALVRKDEAYRKVGLTVPESDVDDYNRARSQVAQLFTRALSELNDQLDELPIGDAARSFIREKLASQDWGLAFLDAVPALKRKSSGALGEPVSTAVSISWAVAASIIAISAAVAAVYISNSVVATASAYQTYAEARTKSLEAAARIAEAVASRGGTPKEVTDAVNDALDKSGPPPKPPDIPNPLGDISSLIMWGIVGYFAIQFLPTLTKAAGREVDRRYANDPNPMVD